MKTHVVLCAHSNEAACYMCPCLAHLNEKNQCFWIFFTHMKKGMLRDSFPCTFIETNVFSGALLDTVDDFVFLTTLRLGPVNVNAPWVLQTRVSTEPGLGNPWPQASTIWLKRIKLMSFVGNCPLQRLHEFVTLYCDWQIRDTVLVLTKSSSLSAKL